jgi:hypothetical protein
LQFNAAGGQAPYQWSVDNPALASIDASGLLTGIAAGAVVVTALDANGIVGNSGSINVFGGPAHMMSVSPNTATLISSTRNRSLQFTASGAFPPFSFSITNSTIGSIDANTGLFRAFRRAEGSFRVIVSDSAGNSIFSGLIVVQR